MTLTASDLLTLSNDALRALLIEGHPIDAAALDDTEYKGISLGLPHFVEALTWKKFKKTFHRDPSTGVLRGWNVRIVQTGLEDPSWEPQRKHGEPVTFGHYEVRATDGYRMPVPAGRGLMIDYGRGAKNGALDPVRRVRDPIVALNAGSVDLLLGWSYVDLGFTQIGTPSYFALTRDCALTHRA